MISEREALIRDHWERYGVRDNWDGLPGHTIRIRAADGSIPDDNAVLSYTFRPEIVDGVYRSRVECEGIVVGHIPA